VFIGGEVLEDDYFLHSTEFQGLWGDEASLVEGGQCLRGRREGGREGWLDM